MSVNSILGVFAKSPIKPIEEHMRVVCQSSAKLAQFFEAVFKQDWDAAGEVRKTIIELEHEADTIKHQLRLQLPKGIFLPVDRTDLLELLVQQDKIANRSKDITGRIVGRSLQIPVAIQTDFMSYLERCIDATNQACTAINEFDSLLETGFQGREATLVEGMISKIDAIEEDTDAMQIELRGKLQQQESSLNPVDVIFLYDIIDWVGELADLAERVGARLEIMLAR